MNFNEYQQKAFTVAIYPEHGTGSQLAIIYTALGLGEAGEVQGKVKKIIRDYGGVIKPEMKEAIIDELSDVLWYVAALCTEMKVNLDDVAVRNLVKLFDRQERNVIGGSGDNR